MAGGYIPIGGSGGGGGSGVASLNTLTGAVNLTAGANITITPSGQNIQISASASSAPGGTNGQLQYNNSGAFAGDSGTTTDGAGHLTAVSYTGDGSALTIGTIAVLDTAPKVITGNSVNLACANLQGQINSLNNGYYNTEWRNIFASSSATISFNDNLINVYPDTGDITLILPFLSDLPANITTSFFKIYMMAFGHQLTIQAKTGDGMINSITPGTNYYTTTQLGEVITISYNPNNLSPIWVREP